MKVSAHALLFDMDGTLLSSLRSVVRCWTRWAREYGISPEDFERVELHGRPAAEIITDLLPAGSVPDALARIERLEIDDSAREDGVELLPGTAALLASLPEGSWAVVTSATRALAEARLRQAGIDAPLLVAADDVVRGKPDPEPYLLAAGKLGARAERCVVFEDAPAGLAAGRAAGMRTVGLATTHDAGQLSADVLVADLSAVSAKPTAEGVEVTAGE
jgi:sugar-phosphatase